MLVYCDDDLVVGQPKLATEEIYDADVCLMRNHPVDLMQGDARFFTDTLRRRSKRGDGHLENSLAIHAQKGISDHVSAYDIPCRMQNLHLAAIRIELSLEDTGLFTGAQHHGSRTVTEEHASAAVVPVKNAGKHLGADDQSVLSASGADEGVRHGERIDKAATYRLNVERCRPLVTQLCLYQTRGARENEIWGGGCDNDQVELCGVHAGVFQGLTCSPGGQLAGGDTGISDMTLPDAGAFCDPGIRGFDLPCRQFRRQLIVGDDAGRQVAARTDYLGIRHNVLPGSALVLRSTRRVFRPRYSRQLAEDFRADARLPRWCWQAGPYEPLHAYAGAHNRTHKRRQSHGS